MFGLKFDYKVFIKELVHSLLERTGSHILLVPHTFGPPGNINSDPDASRHLLSLISDAYVERVHMIMREYDQSGIKGIIRLCDFFIGSRMHACIAALSQDIPTVGIAYSQKFIGVFDSIGSGNTVIDARITDEETTINAILKAYENRQHVSPENKKRIILSQDTILEAFKALLK
jgi:polysaccharide pyruvyl transferase WcaK-like protein